MSKLAHSNQETMDQIECNAANDPDENSVFYHATPKPDACDHNFTGWHDFPDGNGGEQVCSKCGLGAMAYSLQTGF